ncbi:MAG TPA: type 2 lanthipeptide synthetase LanM family protein, partial [Ktedonobacteraceae bacterium]|nr:type 2 lanthipeptide synthetase LanM family protein [Ktedonobacteraceae bacterium]
MPLTYQELSSIAAAASTMSERLHYGLLSDDIFINDKCAQDQLTAWCHITSGGDWQSFDKRLALDGLDEESVKRILGTVGWREDMPLPAWLETVQEALRLVEATDCSATSMLFLDTRKPLPFEDLLAPFVVVAQQRIQHLAGAAYYQFADAAHVALQRYLLYTLVAPSVETLHQELTGMYGQEQDDLRLYQQFVRYMRHGGLEAFFQQYSVLTRQLATITDLWVETIIELLQRLAADFSLIERTLASEKPLGQVTMVQPFLSDFYAGRRSVMALTFVSGRKLVYKPKDIGMEEAYYHLLAWCNEQGILLPFKVLAVLNRSGYGWVEFVEHEPCRDLREGQLFYQRTGMLLCLVYALAGRDCYYENIIACGEHPVLVDLTRLMQPRPRLGGSAIEENIYSVLHTGLLSGWQIRSRARERSASYDISGLGALGAEPTLATQQKTQPAERASGALKTRRRTNIPRLDGTPLRLDEHVEEVLKGFQQMYSFLLQQRVALLAPASPLRKLAHHQVRFSYRASWIYQETLQKLNKRTYLCNGVDRSIQLERLGRSILPLESLTRGKGDPSLWWPVYSAERQTLEQGDIPYFTARGDSDALTLSAGQKSIACLQGSSFDQVIANFNVLSEEDRQRQVGYIRRALLTPVPVSVLPEVKGTARDLDAVINGTSVIATEPLLAHAVNIAEDFARQAICLSDGSVTWLSPQHLMRDERYQLRPIRSPLFDGCCGVALFLAAMARITAEADYRELALKAIQPLQAVLRKCGQETASMMGIGGAIGLGSVVYAFTRISQLLGEPSLLEDAQHAACLITAEAIAGDTALDVIAGSAGTILGLLALYEIAPRQAILDRAAMCGQHLLRVRTPGAGGYHVWSTLQGKPATGFSHGAAGIIYALLRLYATTQDRELFSAACEGIAWENSLFSSEASNWADVQGVAPPIYMTTWCHGA